MTMASVGRLFIFTVIYMFAESATKIFVDVDCKTENVGQYGQLSLLECVVKTSQDVVEPQIVSVSWSKEGVEKPLVAFYNGKTTQQPGYSFAEPAWKDTNMNVSLLIANTAVQDEGVYTCEVMTDSGRGAKDTSFKVTAKYRAPTVTTKPETLIKDKDGTLMCSSSGGYPEGKLRWFDEHNEEWANSAESEAKQAENGLFHLSSKLTLLRGSTFSKYTCAVYNGSGGKEDEFTFVIPDDPDIQGQGQDKGQDSVSKIVAPLVVIGSLIVGLLLLLLWHRRRLRPSHRGVKTCESDGEEDYHQEADDKCQDSPA